VTQASKRSGERSWIAEVIVVPKPGVNDPQGEAIHGGIRSLGFSSVTQVRSGRFFRLSLSSADRESATSEANEMCERLLANPVIETFTVSVRPAEPDSVRGTS
jgi:phosphoribosylformylglycinamidine synthase PurS subunit